MRKEKGSFQDGTIVADPNGSYTGKPKEEGEKPVQDVDDL